MPSLSVKKKVVNRKLMDVLFPLITVFQCSLNTVGGTMAGSPLTTHVLDTARGQAAPGLPITLYRRNAGDAWTQLATG